MKKILSLVLIAVLLTLCCCTVKPGENTATYFYFDTVVTVTADCEKDIIEEAFAICQKYEAMLSRTLEGSEISLINNSTSPVTVSVDTAKLINDSLYYSRLTSGKFDITVCPVSRLYDFDRKIIPDGEEISKNIGKVGYSKLSVEGNTVTSGDAEIDLGGIAKGFIADKITEFLLSKGVKNATVNIGGNLKIIGDSQLIGIKEPFAGDKVSVYLEAQNTSIVTSGVYERGFYENGKLYHHILSPFTGLPVDTDLYSATVICENSERADALATVCIILGKTEAMALINSLDGVEAVFIDSENGLSATDGLSLSADTYSLIK